MPLCYSNHRPRNGFYRDNNAFVTWPEFLEDVRHRFDPQSFKNFTGLIAKLVQTTTVADYHATFEGYLNRVNNLTEEALIPIFIQGLKQPIQEKVKLQYSASLDEAMALALRLAATHDDRQQRSSTFSRRQWSGRENRFTLAPPPGPTANTRVPSQTGDACSRVRWAAYTAHPCF